LKLVIQLENHDGKCARLHGHSWIGRIVCEGDKLQESGPKKNMLIDYGDLKNILTRMVDKYLDHHHLNSTLNTNSPTSEFIAQWIYHYLKEQLPKSSRSNYLRNMYLQMYVSSTALFRENESCLFQVSLTHEQLYPPQCTKKNHQQIEKQVKKDYSTPLRVMETETVDH